MKNPTLAGIEPATFRLVAEHLNHCTTAVNMTKTTSNFGAVTSGWQTHLPIVCSVHVRCWQNITWHTRNDNTQITFRLTKVKVQWSRYRPGVAQRVGRGIALHSHDRGTRRGWVVSSMPQCTLPPGKTRYPLYRRLGGPQGRSGRAENLVPTGIRSRTVKPVAQSLYRLSYPAHV